MKKIIKLNENDIENLVKKIIKEEGEEYRSKDPDQLDMFDGTVKDRELEQEYKEWEEEDDKMTDIYNDIYDTLEPVLNNILDKYGEDFDLIANDDMIQNIVEDWMYPDGGDED